LRWDDVIRVVLSMPPHRDLAISKWLVPHPSEAGFKRRLLAEPRGQRGDWELVVDGRAVHVREYDSHYLVHWDRASPSRSPLRHLLYDAPHWLIPIVAGVAVGISAALGVGPRVGAAGALAAVTQLVTSRWP
jgi:hypothetical protein